MTLGVTVLLIVGALVAGSLRPAPEVVTAGTGEGAGGTGVTSTRGVSDLTTQRWSAGTSSSMGGYAPMLQAAVAAGERLLVTAGRDTLAIERGNGAVEWRLAGVAGTPVVVDGQIPVAAGDELLWLSPATGRIERRVAVHDPDEPAVGTQTAAFSLVAGPYLVARAPVAVLTRDGEVQWAAHDGGSFALAVADGVVVLAGRDGGLVGRGLTDGSVRWRFGMRRASAGRARLVDGTLVVADVGGKVTGLDPATGRARWSLTVPQEDLELVGAVDGDVVLQSPAEPGGPSVVVSVSDGRRRSPSWLPATGHLLSVGDGIVAVRDGGQVTVSRLGGGAIWRGDTDVVSVTQAADRVVIAGAQVGVLVVDATDGRVLASLAGAGPPGVVPRPTVLDDQVLTVSSGGELAARSITDGETTWSTAAGSVGCCTVLADGTHLVLPHPLTVFDRGGEQQWAVSAADGPYPSFLAVAGPWVLTWEAVTSNVRLRRVADGREGPALGIDGYVASVRHDDRRLYVQIYEQDGASAVAAFPMPDEDAGTQVLDPLWRIPAAVSSRLVRTSGELLLVGVATVDHIDPATGEIRQRTELPTIGPPEGAVADGLLVRTDDGGGIETTSLDDGAVRWAVQLDAPLAAAPTVAGNLVYLVDTADRLHVLSLADGHEVTAVDLPGAASAPVTVARGVVIVPLTHRLVAYGPPPSATREAR